MQQQGSCPQPPASPCLGRTEPSRTPLLTHSVLAASGTHDHHLEWLVWLGHKGDTCFPQCRAVGADASTSSGYSRTSPAARNRSAIPLRGTPGRQSLMQVLISLSISHNAGVLLSLCAYRCHLSGNGADSMNSRAGWVAVSLPVPLPWAGCDGTNSMCRVTRGTPGCLIAAGAVVLAV